MVHLQHEAFGRLTELACESVRLRRGLGVLLTGESGSGKSHLLGRLARWSAVGSRACFVVVRGLQTDPELLPAAVMRSAGAALAGRAGAKPVRTPLYRLAHGAARVALTDNQERYSWERVGKAFDRLLERAGLSLDELYMHGREHEELYQVAELLTEWDERIWAWRFRHYAIVARALGEDTIGTQGTPVQVLGKLIAQRQIPKLWEVRSRLVELFEAERARPPA